MTERQIISCLLRQYRFARSREAANVKRKTFFFVSSRLRANKSSIFRFIERPA